MRLFMPDYRLAIVGYGKMGKLVERIAPEFGFEVALKLDVENNANFECLTREHFRHIDAAIDFSTPHAVVPNCQGIAALGVNLVIGTTGWNEQLSTVRAIVEKHGTGAVWSPNFSIGVNVFMRVVAEASRLLAEQPDYGAWAWEIHHNTKKDSPSGTLLKLVHGMRKAGYERAIDVAANRAGAHPGTHEVGFDSAADTITLRHTARNREGFARGALQAAKWIIGKKGFHEFSEIV
jgi:4-hydroxy-tetrahydrodipicolinate reductase